MVAYSLKQLRMYAIGEAALDDFEGSNGEVLTEAAIRELFILDEAYFGKNALKEIDQVMCRIEKKISENKYVDVCAEPEGKELDEAIKKAFGFKSVHVYWYRDPDMRGVGPCTLPAARVMNDKNKNLKYGSFKSGFYDKDHVMTVFVQMDNALVTECHLTGAEMTAILIHELGHNFDFTPFALIKIWFEVIELLVNALRTGRFDEAIAKAAVRAAVSTDIGRKIYIELMNLSDTIGKLIPPIGYVSYWLSAAKGSINKIINMILSPVALAVTIPTALLCMPLQYFANFFTRKSETYADSLAAVYGYGPEQASAIDKLGLGIHTFNNAPRGIFTIFDNFVMVYQEIMTLTYGGHGTTQQRCIRMLDALKREVDNPALDAATKKACKEEISRLEDMYKQITSMNDDERMFLTKCVRGIMDQWYAGTAPNLLPIMYPEYTYAK